MSTTNAAVRLLCILGWAGLVRSIDNGLALLPPMGYNTWYDVTGAFNEELLKQTVDAFITLGLPDFGYNYWNLDDLWSGGRYDNGTLYADKSKLPSGTLRPLADYVHSKNLKFGAYTDRGTKQCGPGPGSQGHEALDAQTFADWQIDYLKEDSCSAPGDQKTAFEQYGKMRDGLNKTGRPIVFSLCGWHPWYAPKGAELGNLWRIGPDDTNWHGVLANINLNVPLAQYAGPGAWNDPCLLLAEDLHGHQRITELQSRAQFSMWAIMASPLIISANIRNMSSANVETYTNKEVIAVDQDVLGIQGERIYGDDLTVGAVAAGNGQAAAVAACDANDPHQQWMYGAANNVTPPGTFYSPQLRQCLDVFNCGGKLVFWNWVTNGCQGNKGFYFNFTAQGGMSQLSAATQPGGCVTDDGGGVALQPCADARSDAQMWEYAAGQLRSAAGRCLTTQQPPPPPGATRNVWARKLSGGRYAFVFINTGAAEADVVCDAACIAQTDVAGKQVRLRDLWAHADLGVATLDSLNATALPAAGGHRMYLATPV